MKNVLFQHQYLNLYVQLSVTPGVSRNIINSTNPCDICESVQCFYVLDILLWKTGNVKETTTIRGTLRHSLVLKFSHKHCKQYTVYLSLSQYSSAQLCVFVYLQGLKGSRPQKQAEITEVKKHKGNTWLVWCFFVKGQAQHILYLLLWQPHKQCNICCGRCKDQARAKGAGPKSAETQQKQMAAFYTAGTETYRNTDH